ncbi:MAG: hypothetical protein M1158_04080 [Candidatus Marsarchaeota archaeon]|jgi:hypothetical protein|nr:hypothetical protein [Candidatus Marsarchaeota archaeon]
MKQYLGSIFVAIAIILFVASDIVYTNYYHKAVSSVSNFGSLFTGIFWFFIGIIAGAIFFAIGLIWVYPKGAKWLAERGK